MENYQPLVTKLVNLGLTNQEAKVYLHIFYNGPLPSKEIATRLKILPHAVYRTAKRLLVKKLIVICKKNPLTYQALSPKIAFSTFVEDRALKSERDLGELSGLLARKELKNEQTQVNFLSGKYQIFMESAKDINEAKSEVLIISIGENIPNELLLANSKAAKRGVKVCLIAHKYDETNKAVLESFKQNGLHVRHYPDWGFHLVVYDGKKSLIMVNNPSDPEERVGIKFYSQGLSKALRDYFYSVWEKAIEV